MKINSALINATYNQGKSPGEKMDEVKSKVGQNRGNTSVDQFIKSDDANTQKNAGVYAKNGTFTGTVSEMLAESERKLAEFQELIKNIISENGEAYNAVIFGKKVFVTPEESLKAQEAIAEGGDQSVEKVAEKIVDFAKALSGGDPAKADLLLDAFEKGFKEAEKAWGDKLPEHSYKIQEEVRARFAAWKNGTE